MGKKIAVLMTVLACELCVANDEIVVKGLLKNMVVLEINGVQRTIRAGGTSPEGIKLISASTKEAIVEIDGDRRRLELSRRIGGVPYTEPERELVRISRGVGGHYFTPGRINGRQVSFLVDTGATSVVMNSLVADKLRIDYRAGTPIKVQTASGIASGYRVTLQSVAVGNVKVNNVEAVVNAGAYPTEILLGNTYLGRVEMKVDRGVLILQAKY